MLDLLPRSHEGTSLLAPDPIRRQSYSHRCVWQKDSRLLCELKLRLGPCRMCSPRFHSQARQVHVYGVARSANRHSSLLSGRPYICTLARYGLRPWLEQINWNLWYLDQPLAMRKQLYTNYKKHDVRFLSGKGYRHCFDVNSPVWGTILPLKFTTDPLDSTVVMW
jgi:hypothetical protein